MKAIKLFLPIALLMVGCGLNEIVEKNNPARIYCDLRIDALKLMLEEYRRDNGSYPRVEGIEVAVKALYGEVDEWGVEIPAEKRVKPSFSEFPSNRMDDDGFPIMTTDPEEILPLALVDPWGNPYVYEYPRRDGHIGFLLFSKGPDGESSVFDSLLSATPEKKDVDLDNIPSSEPGKWVP